MFKRTYQKFGDIVYNKINVIPNDITMSLKYII